MCEGAAFRVLLSQKTTTQATSSRNQVKKQAKMVIAPPIMLKAPILAYLAIWTPKVSPIYLKLILFLRRLERTFDVLVFAYFSFQ